jgi:hypothetical protein
MKFLSGKSRPAGGELPFCDKSHFQSSSQTRARPVPNGGRRSSDVNCEGWMIIHVNSNKVFSDSNPDQEDPREKRFSQNSRNPSAISEIVFLFFSGLKMDTRRRQPQALERSPERCSRRDLEFEGSDDYYKC